MNSYEYGTGNVKVAQHGRTKDKHIHRSSRFPSSLPNTSPLECPLIKQASSPNDHFFSICAAGLVLEIPELAVTRCNVSGLFFCAHAAALPAIGCKCNSECTPVTNARARSLPYWTRACIIPQKQKYPSQGAIVTIKRHYFPEIILWSQAVWGHTVVAILTSDVTSKPKHTRLP